MSYQSRSITRSDLHPTVVAPTKTCSTAETQTTESYDSPEKDDVQRRMEEFSHLQLNLFRSSLDGLKGISETQNTTRDMLGELLGVLHTHSDWLGRIDEKIDKLASKSQTSNPSPRENTPRAVPTSSSINRLSQPLKRPSSFKKTS